MRLEGGERILHCSIILYYTFSTQFDVLVRPICCVRQFNSPWSKRDKNMTRRTTAKLRRINVEFCDFQFDKSISET